MEVSPLLWILTVGGIMAVIVIDLIIATRRKRDYTPADAVKWIVFYIALALAFAAFIWVYYGADYGQQFVAGYILEYSLSVDNLFVYMVIMASFAVPSILQNRVLLIAIVMTLLLRAILIVIGAGIVAQFVAVFYLFGAFLLYTAWKVGTSEDEEPDPEGNGLVRFAAKHLPVSSHYDGTKMITRVADSRALTPMAMVIFALGTSGLLFALDSIPAVFGITTDAYLVLTVNAFALMGLRQLYFLVEGVLGKLKYLNVGLAIILAFIGVGLILEAIHETTDLHVPEIPVWFSLSFIVVVLGLTAVVSVIAAEKSAHDAPAANETDDEAVEPAD